ncbi:terpenoid cyclases/protein prenyltransferase alpha-alpha toroid [Cokeromyces recurvatus]|uniref:terpenoid cyclases/protein prenyltransferase alpha-alpha toroid n=1 Tax=Cokeromyces recurvatus TaxID=90255 RepID=UPI002220D1D9|nr:terpenoid cyclases/protein prenyltransferase alpha-alpha toroid [Cokeromyces recurvatus]KAI7899408.1 terpenoid cyclases/protein prenyltransferase alpha-alpha toroid [Cokeromyces recurvatus]
MGILNGNVPLNNLRFKDDNLPTDTSIEQKRTEDSVLEKFVPYAPNNIRKLPLESIELDRKKHIAFLKRGLAGLGRWGAALDASKPWVAYWILHSLELLEYELDVSIISRTIETCKSWQLPTGGFGGGGDQLAHLATTYAAINSLAIIGTKEAYEVINRETLYRFLMSMKQPDGSFTMHKGGEIDIRGSYCALSVALLTNLLTPELTENCIEFIRKSQTYEGGIGPYPGKEAHNGYTFCGLAAMEILEGMSELRLDSLTYWCSSRQMSLEGGFQGRTNKLVDGCYSFWGAGDFPIIRAEQSRQTLNNTYDYLFDREALQEYILLCCQSELGGLIDKPGKSPDFYHTCYCLSGLSIAQHSIRYHPVLDVTKGLRSLLWTYENEFVIVGHIDNLLAPTHPVHNITLRSVRNMIQYFYKEELKDIEHLLPKDDDPDIE